MKNKLSYFDDRFPQESVEEISSSEIHLSNLNLEIDKNLRFTNKALLSVLKITWISALIKSGATSNGEGKTLE